MKPNRRGGRPSQKKPETPRSSGTGAAPEPHPGLRDFDLADFSKVAPETIAKRTGTDRHEQLFLALALAYNDLKDIHWFLTALKEGELVYRDITPQRAQLVGMTYHGARFAIGVMCEVLRLLHKFEVEVRGEYVGRLVRRLSAQKRRAWGSVVAVALGDVGDVGDERSGLFNSLKRIRDQTAFHYHQPKTLLQGYQRHFFENEKSVENDAAYYSDGNSMEETRFYFADVAARENLLRHDNKDAAMELGREMNVAVKHVIIEYIRDRERGS